MGISSSSSSSSPTIDFKNIELDQRIALFAKYLENSNNSNKNQQNRQAYFWTCQVIEQNNDKSDAQVECAVGVPPNYNKQENNFDDDDVPLNSSIKMWLKKDHGSLYQLQKATKEDEERKFFSIFPPNDQRLRKVWIDENTGKLNQKKKVFHIN